MRNSQAAKEKPADAERAGGETRAEREGAVVARHEESWKPDWAGWLARKAALRAASGICSDAPPSSDGVGRQGVTQQGSGSAGSGR